MNSFLVNLGVFFGLAFAQSALADAVYHNHGTDVQAAESDEVLDLSDFSAAVTQGSCWARAQGFDKHGYHLGDTRSEAMRRCLSFHTSCESQCGSSALKLENSESAFAGSCSLYINRAPCLAAGCFWNGSKCGGV